MRTFLILSTIATVEAVWDNSYWNTSAGASCPGLYYGCVAPLQWCSHNDPLDKYYCCDILDGVCWDGAESYQTDGNGNLASTLQACGNTFYCLSPQYESCTARAHQSNICWSNEASPVGVQYEKQLNDTFSSLTSAQPQATSFAFNMAAMLATITATSSSSSTPSSSPTSSQTSTASKTAPTSTGTSAPGSSGVSGGTIAGAVVGAVAGVALIVAGILFFLRRRKAKNSGDAPLENTHHEPNVEPWQSPETQELPYNEYRGHFAPTKQPLLGIQHHRMEPQAELPTHVAPVELSSGR